MTSGEEQEFDWRGGGAAALGLVATLVLLGMLVLVTLTNSARDQERHVDSLRKRIDWIKTFGDPGAAYAQAMGQVLSSLGTQHEQSSRLGLVRVIHEGACTLDVDLSGTGRVSMRAKRRLP